MKISLRRFSLITVGILSFALACGPRPSQQSTPISSQQPNHPDSGLFQSQRSFMRSLQSNDFQDLKGIMSDPANQSMSGDVIDDNTVQGLVNSPSFVNNNRNWNILSFGIISKDNKKFVGMIQIYRPSQLPTFPLFVGPGYSIHPTDGAVGYSLAKALWGKGLMTEVLTSAIDFGKTQLGLTRYFSETLTSNIGSQKVLQKVGFKNIGQQMVYSSKGVLENRTYFEH